MCPKKSGKREKIPAKKGKEKKRKFQNGNRRYKEEPKENFRTEKHNNQAEINH